MWVPHQIFSFEITISDLAMIIFFIVANSFTNKLKRETRYRSKSLYKLYFKIWAYWNFKNKILYSCAKIITGLLCFLQLYYCTSRLCLLSLSVSPKAQNINLLLLFSSDSQKFSASVFRWIYMLWDVLNAIWPFLENVCLSFCTILWTLYFKNSSAEIEET